MKTLKLYITLGLFFALSGAYVSYMNNIIGKRETEALNLKKETAHKQAIYLLQTSVDNFTTLISGIRSYIVQSEHMPDAYELQSYTNQCLEKISFNDSLVVSYLNKSHVFIYSFTQKSINKNDLAGVSLISIRNPEEIQFLDNVMKDQELHFNYPINLVEGWLGLPVMFNVTKDNQSVGYIAAIINVGTILNSIYESEANNDFIHKFTTDKGFDFDRRAIYNNKTIYNNKIDENFYEEYSDRDVFITSPISLHGIGIELSTAFKHPPSTNYYRLLFVYSWLSLVGLVIGYIILRYFKEQNADRKLRISNERITEQNIQLGNQKEEFTNLLENLGDGVFELDDKGKCIYVNSKMLEMLNMKREDVMSSNIWEMTYLDDVLDMQHYFGNKFREKASNCYYNYRLNPKDRPPLWIEQSSIHAV